MIENDERDPVDVALEAWRQGDATRDFKQFVFLADLAKPLTHAAVKVAEETVTEGGTLEIEGVTVDVEGFVVVSQTCDIVRPCSTKPYLEIAALVKLDEAPFRETQKLRRINFAEVPALRGERLVADLDRVMTVEKPIVAGCARIAGCRDIKEARRFARALARKRQRFAYPQDFVDLARPLEALLKQQSRRAGDGMAHVECLEEIRVMASPDWSAKKIELQFVFIKNGDPPNGGDWSNFANEWMRVLPINGRFSVAPPLVGYLRDFDAELYTESDPLDLDALSPERE